MTSANVTEYDIRKNGIHVGSHRQNWMCKTSWDSLLKYQPLTEHTITSCGYDEDEEYWRDEPVNLYYFLLKISKTDKSLKSFFLQESRDEKINKII